VNEPKVSIIVPVYKAEDYLQRCVNSLTNQTLTDIEIILVDDGSPGISPRLCDEMAQKDNRIKVIHKENGGAGYARNSGLKIAKGKYIGFVDSDDFVEKDMYEVMYTTLEKYDSDLVMTGIIQEDGCVFGKEGDCEIKTFFKEDTHFETFEELKGLRLGIIGSLPGEAEDSRYGMSVWKNLFKREIIEKNNLTFQSERQMLSEDALFMVDYIASVKKATGINRAFYHYCRNGDSISKSYKKDRFEKALVFLKEAEKRYQKDIPQEEYKIYLDRFWQSFCRVLCSQEVMYCKEQKADYATIKQGLKKICEHDETRRVLKTYPIAKLPLKQRIFAYAMKYRLYYLQVKLIIARSR